MEILYQHKDKILSKADKFVYEVSLYLVYKDRFELIDNKYLASNKLLKYKEYESAVIDKQRKQIKIVDFIAAPEYYLTENGYKSFEHYTKREIKAIKQREKKNNSK